MDRFKLLFEFGQERGVIFPFSIELETTLVSEP